MKVRNLKRLFFYSVAAIFVVFLLFFLITCIQIGSDAKDQCQKAKAKYDGNCTQALIDLLNDENQSFKARNSAIWALGQLGDNRALPVLQNYYAGNIPAREPINEVISQRELKKAINLTSGGFNITAIFWRTSFLNKEVN